MQLTATRIGTVLHISGELDVGSVPRFHLSVAHAEGTIETIDLADLEFVDSSGVRALMVLRRRYPNVEIVNPTAQLQRLVDIVGVGDQLFDRQPAVSAR